MHRSRIRLAPLALTAALVVLAGCSKPAAADATTDPADSAAAAATASDERASEDATPKQTDTAASGFVLDMDKVDAYYATLVKIGRMARTDASLRADQDGDGEEDDPVAMDASEGIDAYIARMEADPRAKRLVTSAGMSVSDFAHTNAAMLEGMMTAGMMEATGKKDVPAGINPQYVEFVRAHKAELEAKLQAMQAQVGAE